MFLEHLDLTKLPSSPDLGHRREHDLDDQTIQRRPPRCHVRDHFPGAADIAAHGAYYGVVCNAGLTHDTAFPAMSEEAWDSVIRANLDAFYNVLQPVVMPMVRRRAPGRIVTLSSVSGLIGNRGQVNYSAAKAGVIGATKALAVELAKRSITVNCVAPGLIETDMSNEHAPVEEILKAIPAQRMGTADEVAAVVSFLVSPGAAYVTRQVIAVNGGLC